MTSKNVLVALMTLTAALTATGPAMAAEEGSPSWGGSGGFAAFNFRCDSGGFLTGMSGRAGAYIDSIQPTCQFGGSSPYLGGTTGGVAYNLNCPTGSVVNGIIVNSGSLIDGYLLICSTLESLSDGLREEEALPHVGGNGGNVNIWRCSPGKAVTGFFGLHGIYLDRFALVCNDVP